MVRKKVPTELDRAEIKLRTLMDRRDALNEDAHLIRQERDQLHEQKHGLSDEMRKLKDERDAFVRQMRSHKNVRNDLQDKARKLIDLRRKFRGKGRGNVAGELAALKKDVARMDFEQQTVPMKLSEENELLEDLKTKIHQMRELEKMKGEQDAVTKEVREIDGTIDDLFKKADSEHAHVIAFSNKANEIHDKVTELVKNVAVLSAEANKKHEAYLDVRGRADEVHKQVMEMREKVLSVRDAERAEAREARQILKEHRQNVRRELYDEKKLDEFADQAVQALLKKGKVEIRG
jgi:uncharacterized coiled-coil DUF342 family protein